MGTVTQALPSSTLPYTSVFLLPPAGFSAGKLEPSKMFEDEGGGGVRQDTLPFEAQPFLAFTKVLSCFTSSEMGPRSSGLILRAKVLLISRGNLGKGIFELCFLSSAVDRF